MARAYITTNPVLTRETVATRAARTIPAAALAHARPPLAHAQPPRARAVAAVTNCFRLCVHEWIAS